MRAHEDDSTDFADLFFCGVCDCNDKSYEEDICGEFVRKIGVSKPVRSRACRWYINCATLHAMYDLL